ncbi:hypothetical protein [Corynebacterium heidelbergense]|uniref:DUF2273 domain-containing protein n=1 Tax=Corynebacterium heidelbergense TaxID=2055947 RepID=A0A364V824_9CORY|nr:hypothetical protein [Corynebacterium heidelbergense]RAV32813.1 hypothetical protein DLJ54_01535 [Corynebacterium heidelbergense]
MKNATYIGILLGFLLAVGAMWQGLAGFLTVLLFCGICGLIGAHLEGKIDLTSIAGQSKSGRG